MERVQEPGLGRKTAGTLKWNTIDRVATQVLYAVIGVILANVLSKEDYGEVGVLLVFQAFATVFVDSGFGAALLQKKSPDERDYSTVFWFNVAVSLVIYCILFLVSPLFAGWFGSESLPALSRVMFLTFVINALAIVQTNRLMKRMDVRMIAVSNTVGLIVSGGVGVWLALAGYGAWALVWQSVALATVKTVWLWVTGHWWPRTGFSMVSMRGIWRVGMGVFSSSFLNTLCLNIYSFVIAAFYSLGALGVYTQGDKWSKMGSASVSQILTASFVPLLSRFQADMETFRAYVGRINRFTGLILFPFMMGLAVAGTPIFHLLFGDKWDEAIPLFQILTVRGVFIVLISLYGNYLLSLGYARTLFRCEVVKDVLIFVALLATVFSGSVEILVWGQFISSAVTYLIVLRMTSRHLGMGVAGMVSGLMPYLLASTLMCIVAWLLSRLAEMSWLQLLMMVPGGLITYWLTLRLTGNLKGVLDIIKK